MNEIELVLLLMVVVAALTPVARALRVPYPVLLVVGGLILALIPAVPGIELTPELVFLLFLPPLVYHAAFTTSVRDFRLLFRPILSLAVGLVLATTAVVAILLHTIMPDLGWPVAFAFGAIVSPPDAVAAAAVFRGLGVPRRIVTLLEGESLINDATALVTYRAALGAVAVAFSAEEASARFVVVAAGGVLVGLVIAIFINKLERRIDDPPVEITLSLLAPFATYLPAELLGVSGVLAAVTAGLFLGWRAPYVTRSDARLRGRAVWDMVEFILNGLVFILIGLQLATILPTLEGRSMLSLIGLGLLISLTLVAVRMVWVFGDAYIRLWLARFKLSRHPNREPNTNDLNPSWRGLVVVGWAGMRGVVSLAAVLSLPSNTPERNLLIFLTFFVILATLVGQGLTLPLLIRTLGVGADSSITLQQEQFARRTATEAAITRIERLRAEWPTHAPLIDTLRVQYDHRASHLGYGSNGASDNTQDGNGAGDPEQIDQELLEHHMIRRAVIEAERSAVLELRERGEIEDAIWTELERDFDLEELRMDA
ncbi:MAG: Na+/H+ antiporter [Chloroflexota bacterium]